MADEKKLHQQCDEARAPSRTLVSFESGHYKKITGEWKGDSVWCHFQKPNGKRVHLNKEKIEYIEEL
jgi:hypothetical protein